MKTAMQELFSKLEVEHPALFNTNTQQGRKFIKERWEFLELEKKQLRKCYHFAQIEQQKEFSSIYVGMSFEKWYNEIYKDE